MGKYKKKSAASSLGRTTTRTVNGKQILTMKAAPGIMKQTVETKKAAKVFGKVSSLEKEFRKTLDAQYAGLFTRETGNEIRGRLNFALHCSRLRLTGGYKFKRKSLAGLAGTEFNSKSTVRSLLSSLPEVKLKHNVLSVSLSKQVFPAVFKFPLKTITCEIVVGVSFFRLEDGLKVDLAEMQSMVVNKGAGAPIPNTFKFDVPPGTLCLVSLFLNYSIDNRGGGRLLKDHTFSPGCFCAAIITPGKYQNSDQRIWRKSVKLD